jgi:hypothetical protein
MHVLTAIAGSVIWVINGFFVFLPLAAPETEFPGEVSAGGGWTAWLGATVFEFGSVLLMLEAVNENREACFGWALEEAFEGEGAAASKLAHSRACQHSHADRRGPFVKGNASDGGWQWWPSWAELRTHYLREIGFLACAAQMFGATIFWIAGFTGLPQIIDGLSTPTENGVYWLPQVCHSDP